MKASRRRQAPDRDEVRWFTTGTAAAALGVTREGVRHLVREAKLTPAPVLSPNGLAVFYRHDVEQLAAARAVGKATRWARLAAVPTRPKPLRCGLRAHDQVGANEDRSATGGGRKSHFASAKRNPSNR